MAPKEFEVKLEPISFTIDEAEQEERKRLQNEFHHIDEKYTKVILQPFEYYRQLPSKNIRRKIANIFNFWYKCSEDELDKGSKAMHELHNASLIIDDIEDGSDLRRGQPAAHIKFGVPLALNAANYVYFDAMRHMLEEKNDALNDNDRLEGVLEFVKGMMLMHVAQGMEIFWRDENLKVTVGDAIQFQHIPTEQEYFDIIVKKTSEQFTMLAVGLKERSKSLYRDQPALSTTELAKAMGYHFQIRDDLLNLISHKYEAGKGFCEDITEGKFSFPIIYALHRLMEQGEIGGPQASRLLEILRMRTTERVLKQEAYDIIEQTGAFEYCKMILEHYHNKIAREVLRLGGNPVFIQHMDIFAQVL